MLRMMAGLERPSSGEITLAGEPVRGPHRDRGMIFQGYTSFPWLTVRENVAYGLKINGQPTVMASHKQWANGITLDRGQAISQIEDLRQAIVKKNELYFHRHRPQNETYLFLFRKHEQGNNAVEVPQFEALVAEQEKRIRQLKIAQPVKYELIRIEATNE